MPMQATWVVVADGDRATIYSVPRGMARLRPLQSLHRGPGRDTGGANTPRPGMGTPLTRFARQVALKVEGAHREARFDELILVASPAFLGPLRACLSHGARSAVIAEIPRNLVMAPRETLQEQVLRVM